MRSNGTERIARIITASLPRKTATAPVQTPSTPPPSTPSPVPAFVGRPAPAFPVEQQLTAFITEHHAKSSRGDVTGLVDDYADHVDHFDHGIVDREFIRRDEVEYQSPGTRVTESITTAPVFTPLGNGLYSATYSLSFLRIRPDRHWTKGISEIQMQINLTPNGPRITSQRSQSHDLQKGRVLMFALWKRKNTEVIRYWYVLFDNFETPASEFYDAIEHDLTTRELSGLEISRVEYAEGGLLSAQRQYLRMRRERLVFDICAAPLATAWFFFLPVAEIPRRYLSLGSARAPFGFGGDYLVLCEPYWVGSWVNFLRRVSPLSSFADAQYRRARDAGRRRGPFCKFRSSADSTSSSSGSPLTIAKIRATLTSRL